MNLRNEYNVLTVLHNVGVVTNHLKISMILCPPLPPSNMMCLLVFPLRINQIVLSLHLLEREPPPIYIHRPTVQLHAQ